MESVYGLIVVASGKGGVGKTESAVGIAGALHHIGSRPDTILDLDYGASTTRRFGYEPKAPYAQALLDGRIGLDQAVLETDEGLGLTPTTPEIAEAPKSKTVEWRNRLTELKKNALIVVDTSDDIMSAPVAAAILAADILLIPIPLNDTAYERTFPEISGLLAAHGHQPEIMCFAALVDRKTKISEDVERSIVADGVEILARVPKGVAAPEARRKHLSVVAYAKSSNVARAYIDIAKIVYARLQRMNGGARPKVLREMPDLPASA